MLKELIKEILKEGIVGKTEEIGHTPSPYQIGKFYHVRTVTMAIAGELKGIYQNELVFKDASWVADTGRFNEYLKDTSKLKENEPFKSGVIVGRGAIIDCTEISQVYKNVK